MSIAEVLFGSHPYGLSSGKIFFQKSNEPLVHSMFFAKLDTLEHFEMNLIIGLEIQLRMSKLLRGVGVPKTLDNAQSFALVFFGSLP